MSEGGSGVRRMFSRYIKDLRESRRLTQQEISERLGVTKSQISHIENTNRGASRELLTRLIHELKPSLKELEELQAICLDENVGIDLPPDLIGPSTPSHEMKHQMSFREIWIVSARPIEVAQIDERNTFLEDFAADLKAISAQRRGRTSRPARRYVYWTPEQSLPRFRLLFDYLEGTKEIRRDLIEETFQIVVVPRELCLLTFAIYLAPQEGESVNEYDRVGRILIRDSDSSEHLRIVKMGTSDLAQICEFLQGILEELRITGRMPGYRLLSVGELRDMIGRAGR